MSSKKLFQQTVLSLRDQGSELVTAPNQSSEPHAVKGFEQWQNRDLTAHAGQEELSE
jgi:hypothetical protein